MEDKKFATNGEIRQFFVAFLTTVIIVTCYHLGCTIIDYLECSNSSFKSLVVHCYHHIGDEDDEEDEVDSEENFTHSNTADIARNN